MGNVTTIGLDIAKSVFQVHGVDAASEVVVRRKLTRGRVLAFSESLPRCLVGIEACSSSHYWARELNARGHDVRLLPSQYVKPYLKRQKNDAADAEAICEAVTRPTMRFVPVKTPEQQSAMMLHRVRLMLNRQRTQISNALRAHLSEFGVVAPIGRNGIEQLLVVINDENDARITADARLCLRMLEAQLRVVKEQILENDRRVRASARETELGRRLMEIPGVGPLLASAFVATVADEHAFKSGRCLSAWIGLVPNQNSSGGKEKLGSISKAGNPYLRQLLVVGAMAVIRYAERNGTRRPWLVQLMARRTAKVAAVALANKTARMVWALMTSGERYREPVIA
ncbi:IS110 family transposase [Mesorhizobium sp.]|uniref:IS110 family transposase n=1 Tax=Mesorhizobium sp. TaxID=1871066 RepID=UPI000FD53222|nr:IS110 family transposase [Mesorhizobium sp.]RVC64410.1 IS110 family transposase [Mesorhizobium sp. M4B.F.Ca.ET.088.02.2.1]RWF28661.1 MAG: IS110 family transposase [Mesorhizobium sp.]